MTARKDEERMSAGVVSMESCNLPDVVSPEDGSPSYQIGMEKILNTDQSLPLKPQNTSDFVGGVSEGPSMDHSLWSSLPQDLVHRILILLPLVRLFRFRAVCKAWNMMPFQRGFQRLCAQVNPSVKEAWLLMFSDVHYKSAFVFIPAENKWLSMRLPFLPSNVYNITAAGGLLCCRLVDSTGLSFICVSNPLTKEWKRLPPLKGDFLSGLVAMVAAASNSRSKVCYKVILRTKPSGTDEHWSSSALTTEEYDSETNVWRVTGVPQDDITVGKAVCNGTLYFMTWEARNGIYAYDLQRGVWTTIQAPEPYFFTCPHLVECFGRLLLVGGYGRQHMSTVGIKVWQLEATRQEWALVSSMPTGLFDEFLTSPGGMYFDCAGVSNVVYLINYENPPMLVMFDVARGAWGRMLTQPPPGLHKMFRFLSFTPRLEASISC